jgi:hypothetical protein
VQSYYSALQALVASSPDHFYLYDRAGKLGSNRALVQHTVPRVRSHCSSLMWMASRRSTTQ